MIPITTSHRYALFLFLLMGMITAEVLIMQTAAFARQPALLSLAVLFDLTVITSVLFHWLVGKPNGWSLLRAGLLALPMTRLALFILPANALPVAVETPVLLAVIEGAALLVALFRFRTLVQTYRQLRSATDANNALLGSLSAVFGSRAAAFTMGEWHIVQYALLGWRLKPDLPAGAVALSTHRQSGQVALLLALAAVGTIELVAVHLLLARWSARVAFWVTLLSAYGMLFIVAEVMAVLKRPSYRTADALHLRLGIRWRAVIRNDQVERVDSIFDKPAPKAGLLNTTLLTTPNLQLTLREPVTLLGPYGTRKEVSWLTLWLDGGQAALSSPQTPP